MLPSRRSHYNPCSIEDLVRQRELLRRAKAQAPFVDCQECTHNANYFCEACSGTGRIYYQTEIGIVTRLRDWSKKLPLYKRIGYWGCVGIITAFCLIIAGYWIWP